MIISVNICQVTESPCSSVVRATLIYWMCKRAAEETWGLTWYFSGWLSLPANWFQQCCFFFFSFFRSFFLFFFFPKSLIASAATHVASHHNDFIDDTGQIIFSESSCLLFCYQTAHRKKKKSVADRGWRVRGFNKINKDISLCHFQAHTGLGREPSIIA